MKINHLTDLNRQLYQQV